MVAFVPGKPFQPRQMFVSPPMYTSFQVIRLGCWPYPKKEKDKTV